MGFFSSTCPGCDHSIRHAGATNQTSRWMAQAVVLFENGDRISGEYDGYGSVGEHGGDEPVIGLGEEEAWHRACWMIAGKPEFTKPSRSASDQGHFVGDYDPAQPKTKADLDALKARAAADRAARQAAAKRSRAQCIADMKAKGEPIPEWLGSDESDLE